VGTRGGLGDGAEREVLVYVFFGSLKFDVVEDPGKLVFLKELLLEDPQHRQTKPVEEAPPVFEKLIIEVGHVLDGDYVRKKAENPVRGIHLHHNVVCVEVVVEVRLVVVEHGIDHEAMLVEPWELRLKDVSHLKSLKEGRQHPKSYCLIAMVQEGPHNEVHALHVAERRVVAGEG